MHKKYLLLILTIAATLLAACKANPTCPPRTEEERLLHASSLETMPSPTPENPLSPLEVKINGRLMKVDKVVSGPLCNDTWKGTVYVACNVQVAKWEDEPLFLKGCNLSIESGTIVYVAYHNDAAYYSGCSCHTGEQP